MSPVQALSLKCLESWIRIVQYKNGSCGEIDEHGTAWTRCSATEVQAWIAKEFECEVSARQCQNALRFLEQSGRVIRQKRWTNRWTQAYSYSIPSIDPHRPPSQVATDQSVVPPQTNLSSSSTGCSTQKSALERTEAEPAVRNDPPGVATAAAPQHQCEYRSTGMSSEVPKLEGVSSPRSLSKIDEICQQIGSGALPVPSSDPQGYTQKRRDPSHSKDC
jgi:hypothetical protein